MSGFRNFILRGNLVDLAVAVIIGVAFGTVVATFTHWLTSLLPDSADDIFSNVAELLRRVPQRRDRVRDPGGGRLLLRGMPYTAAKEKFFPSPEPGTPRTSSCSRRSATCSPRSPEHAAQAPEL